MTAPLPLTVEFDSDGTVEISGSSAALRQFATLVRSADPQSVELSPRHLKPSDTAYGASLAVEPGEGKMKIQRRGDELVIAGAAASRAVFAANLGLAFRCPRALRRTCKWTAGR